MKKKLRCIFSAIISGLLIVASIDYAFIIGEEQKIGDYRAKTVSQSEVIVKDFIHDNYVISEKNPWTDYGFHPIEYTQSAGKSGFDEKISAKAAILVNINSKEIYYEKNSNKEMYPASTTKLMTALTVLQTMKLTDIITIGDEVEMIAADSSKAGFSRGQVVTVEELLKGMLISSGNDAAYILAKATGLAILQENIANEGKKFSSAQCVQRFIYEMNKNVRDMNLENTHFTTPDGYDADDQYTTASDLSKIAIRAYENEIIRNICSNQSQKSDTLDKTWVSTNELLNEKSEYYYDYCTGMKTGTTDLAGRCLVSVAKNGDTECISVVLGESSDEGRYKDSKKLLQFGVE